jgi:hypothetical protein
MESSYPNPQGDTQTDGWHIMIIIDNLVILVSVTNKIHIL